MAIQSITLIAECQYCKEQTAIKITKKQAKAIFKAFKARTKAEAELIIEKSIGRWKT